jgi:hypothetical protein
MTAVRGVLLTIVVLAGCLVAAVAVANVVDMFAPGTFLHGRNMTRVALLASVLIFVAALLRRHAVQWRQVLIELAVIELVTTGLIWFFSGAVTLGSFFLSWWLGVNGFLVLPWILGTLGRSVRTR